MSDFFDETMQGLLEATEIAKGNISLVKRNDMPAPTLYVADNDAEDITDKVQKKLYNLTFSRI